MFTDWSWVNRMFGCKEIAIFQQRMMIAPLPMLTRVKKGENIFILYRNNESWCVNPLHSLIEYTIATIEGSWLWFRVTNGVELREIVS